MIKSDGVLEGVRMHFRSSSEIAPISWLERSLFSPPGCTRLLRRNIGRASPSNPSQNHSGLCPLSFTRLSVAKEALVFRCAGEVLVVEELEFCYGT
jgi:hypothetical protein